MINTTYKVKIIAWVALCLILFGNFSNNIFGVAIEPIWNNWQLVGQGRVLGGIIADKNFLDKKGANLGEVYTGNNNQTGTTLTQQTYEIYEKWPKNQQVNFFPYQAQFGLQSVIYSWLSRIFNTSNLNTLQTLVAAGTALTVATLFLIYRQIFNTWFAIAFVGSLAFSPYFVTMAKNLYWSPFLFFLPTIAAGWIYLDRRKPVLLLGLFLIAFSMFLKAASNYEYITCVTLLACSVFIAGPFFSTSNNAKPHWILAFWVGCACIVGFIFAFILHASVRGETITEGMRTIYEQDIIRRTFGDSNRFSAETAESLDASVLDVLKIYFYKLYPSRAEMMMPGKLFLILIFISLFGLIHKAIKKHPNFYRDFYLFFASLAIPLSWFIMAKGHSYTQTHINFVLWFIGFMPALIFTSFSSISGFIEKKKSI